MLTKVSKAEIKRDSRMRSEKIIEGVMEYGYSQNEIAKQLRMHF